MSGIKDQVHIWKFNLIDLLKADVQESSQVTVSTWLGLDKGHQQSRGIGLCL